MATESYILKTVLALEAASFIQGAKQASSSFSNLQRELEKSANGIDGAGKVLQAFGSKLTKTVSAPLATIGVASAKAAMDFESAMAGVRKTTDLTDREFAALSKGIREMSQEIPTSAKELAGLAEVAGQLGIEKENLLSFTRVMADLAETTNIAGEEGAAQMAQFANVMQMSQKDFDRMGSTIVDLGNNFATTEQDILNMAQRMAGAGKSVGMTEAQVLSFATALSSVGVNAELGGSAMTRAFLDVQSTVETGSDKLEKYGKVAGMTGEQFKKAFQDDAAGAMLSFVKGLQRVEAEGGSAVVVLEELDINSVQMRQAFLNLAGAGDLLSKALYTGSEAWEENVALVKEAALRYGTTESRIAIAKNRIQDSAVAIGQHLLPALAKSSEAVANLVGKFAELPPSTQKSVVAAAALAAGMGPLFTTVGKATSALGKFAAGLKEGALGSKALAYGLATLASIRLGKAIADWANGLRGYTKEVKRAQGAVDGMLKEVGQIEVVASKSNEIAQKAINRLNELMAKPIKTDAQKIEINALVRHINEAFEGIDLTLDPNGNFTESAEVIEAKFNHLVNNQLVKDLTDARLNMETELTKIEDAMAKALTGGNGKEYDELKKRHDNLIEIIGATDSEIEDAAEVVAKYKGVLEDAGYTIDDTTGELQMLGEAVGDVSQEFNDVATVLENLHPAFSGLSGSFDEIASAIEASGISLDEYVAAWENTYNEIQGIVSQEINLIDAFNFDEWQQTIDENIEIYSTYWANVEELNQRAGEKISQEFIDYWTSQGVTTANALDELVKMQDDELLALQEVWERQIKLTTEVTDREMSNTVNVGTTKTQEFVNAVVEALGNSGEQVSVGADDLRKAIYQAMMSLPDDGTKTGEEYVKALADSVVNQLGLAGDAAEQVKNAIINSFDAGIIEAENKGSETVQSYNQGAENQVASTKQKGEKVAKEFIDPLSASMPKAEKAGAETVDSFNKGAESKKPETIRTSEAIAEETSKGMGSKKEEAKSEGTQTTTNFTDGIKAQENQARMVGGHIGTMFLLALKNTLDGGGTVPSPANIATDAINTMVNQINSMAATLQTAGQSLGTSLGQGVVSGINATIPAIAATASNAMSTATAASQAAGKIHSPSDITIWQGQQVALGWVNGIESMLGRIKNAGVSMANAATDINPDDIQISTAQGHGTGTANQPLKINLRLGKQELTAFAQDISEAGDITLRLEENYAL